MLSQTWLICAAAVVMCQANALCLHDLCWLQPDKLEACWSCLVFISYVLWHLSSTGRLQEEKERVERAYAEMEERYRPYQVNQSPLLSTVYQKQRTSSEWAWYTHRIFTECCKLKHGFMNHGNHAFPAIQLKPAFLGTNVSVMKRKMVRME